MKKKLLNKSLKMTRIFLTLTLCFGLTGIPSVLASSHAEAPSISMDRYADNTDVYAFRSSEAGRSGFVTLISNFVPLQEPSGGPQYFRFDDSVLYEIKIDNTGDGVEDVTYQFRFTTQIVNPNTILGHTTVNQDGIVSSLTDPDYNMPQTYSVRRIVRNGSETILASGLRTPPSNVGPRTTPNYEANLGQPAVYNVAGGGRVFAGQRDEGFFIDLGGTFDTLAYRTLMPTGGVDTLRTYNVNSIAVEVPIQDLTRTGSVPTSSTDPNAVIGVWSTASRGTTTVIQPGPGAPLPFPSFPGRLLPPRPSTGPTTVTTFKQVSRLGNPLVNELIIPLGLKDAFNASTPVGDAVAVPAVLDPELPKLIKIALETYGLLGGPPIPNINIPPAPRTDLFTIFLTGIPAGAVPGLPNYTTFLSDGRPHEYLRLNVAIAPVAPCAAGYSRLGLLGGDIGGFPNGRRVGDDVVDIEIRAALGGTPFTPAFNVAPNNAVGDGVAANFEGFLTRFPYLQTPNQGNQPRPANFPADQLPCPTS